MRKNTLTQSLAAVKVAERKLESSKRRLHVQIAIAAREISKMEAQIASKRNMLHIALVESDSPYTVDQLVTRAGQKHIDAALREHEPRVVEETPAPRPIARKPKTVRKVYTGPAHKNPDCPPVYDEALYHMMLIAKLPGTDKEFVFTSPRLEPVWAPPYYTGENNQYGPFAGHWELPHYPHQHDLEKKVFGLYQDMWRNHREMISWDILDPFWGAGTGGVNERGSICFAPASRIIVRDSSFEEGRYIGGVGEKGIIEISTYCMADIVYAYLNGLNVNDADTIRLLDNLILG